VVDITYYLHPDFELQAKIWQRLSQQAKDTGIQQGVDESLPGNTSILLGSPSTSHS
jgi:hypothetical protein